MSNVNLRISTLSVEPVYVSFRAENPVTGAIDLQTGVATIALVRGIPKATDWVAATVEVGTYRAPDGEQYYVATAAITGADYDRGNYEVYLSIEHGGFTFVQRAGSAAVY